MLIQKKEIFKKYKQIQRPFRVLAYMVMRNLNPTLENYLFIENFIDRIQSIDYRAAFIYSRAKSLCSHPGFITGYEEFEAALFLSVTAQYSKEYPSLRDNELKLYLEAFELIEQELEKIYKGDDDLYKSMSSLYSESFRDFCMFNKGLIPQRNISFEIEVEPDYEIVQYDDGDVDIVEIENDEDDYEEEPFDYNKNYGD